VKLLGDLYLDGDGFDLDRLDSGEREEIISVQGVRADLSTLS
jgi:hypothetical protein